MLGERLRRAALLSKLEENAATRGEAAEALESARTALAKLLSEGRDQGIEVTVMCRHAGIHRERAYDLLAGRGRKVRDVYDSEGGSSK